MAKNNKNKKVKRAKAEFQYDDADVSTVVVPAGGRRTMNIQNLNDWFNGNLSESQKIEIRSAYIDMTAWVTTEIASVRMMAVFAQNGATFTNTDGLPAQTPKAVLEACLDKSFTYEVLGTYQVNKPLYRPENAAVGTLLFTKNNRLNLTPVFKTLSKYYAKNLEGNPSMPVCLLIADCCTKSGSDVLIYWSLHVSYDQVENNNLPK